MIVGYARTSTVEQVAGFEAQVRELQSFGLKKIFANRFPLLRPVRNLKPQSIFAAKATRLLFASLTAWRGV